MIIYKFKNYTYTCEEEFIDEHEIPALNKEEAKDLLFRTQDLLKSIGVDIYLAYGTLLGAVRDKDFCKGDSDIDVYIKDEETLFKNLENLRSKGFVLVRYLIHDEFTFRDLNNPKFFIDVGVLSKIHNIWGLYCYRLTKCYTPKKYLKEDDTINFLGREFKITKNPERILEFWYYDTWNVPMAKFKQKYIYEVRSHYIYTQIKHKFVMLGKKIFGDTIYKQLRDRKLGREEIPD